ncbi:hypothetical protein PSTT_13533, partial [Puccinia striiformis]
NDSSRSCTSILSFTDILSRVPAVREDDLIVITSSEGGKKLVVKSDKELLEDKIMEALATGDKASSTPGGWNRHGSDNSWGQKRKAGNGNWTEDSGVYNQNQGFKNDYHQSNSSSFT